MAAHYYCEDCQTYFDADKNATTAEALVIPAPEHKYEESASTPPSCDAAGEKTYTCECGASYTEEFGTAGHNYGELIAEEEAVHTKDELKAGMEAHYYCEACQTYFDADKNETTYDALVIPAPEHVYDEATGKCWCGAVNGEAVFVAEVDGVQYTSLQAALTVANGAEITLLQNIVLEETWFIADDVVINLGGKEISGDVEGLNGLIYVKKGASLTVKGEGAITATATHAIGNYGTVTIEGGVITTAAGDEYAALYNFYYAGYGEGTAIITAGELNTVFNCGQLTVNGGKIAFLNTSSELTVNGGEIAQILAKDGSHASGAYEIAIADDSIITTEDDFKLVEVREGVYTVVAKNYVAQVGDKKFESLQAAIDAADGKTVVLLDDLTIESELNSAANGLFNIAEGKNVTIDLNGKTIDVTDNSQGNFIVFYNFGELTLKNGTVTLVATNNRQWNAQSTIVLNRGGVLNVESGSYIHNGGTDMAITVCNSGNYYGDATTNVYEGSTISSTYVAIRNRMEQNSHGASGKTYLNIYGGTLYGGSRAIWAQAASGDANSFATGEINVYGGEINAIRTDAHEYAQSMTTIYGGTVGYFKGEVGELTVKGGTVTGNIDILFADGTAVPYIAVKDGLYCVGVAEVDGTYYATLQAAIDAAENGDVITLLQSVSGAGIVIDKSITIDFGGYTYTINAPAVGSAGTQTLGFQIHKNNTVVLKNGKLEVAEAAKTAFAMLIQNYADLTVTDMVLDGTNLDCYTIAGYNYSYVLSNNSGTVAIVDTTIIANDGGVAYGLDSCKFQNYAVPTVTVSGNSNIGGIIEVTGGNLVLNGGAFTGELVYTSGSVTKAEAVELAAPAGFCWNADGVLGVHSYVGVVTDPDCLNGGYTTYTCAHCEHSYVDDETAAKGHNEITDEAVAPSCTETGLTEGKHCDRCGETLVAQETVGALGHNEITDEAVAPSCTETGLTEGKHCDRCGETLVAQETVSALGHNFVDGECDVCHEEDPDYVCFVTNPVDTEGVLNGVVTFYAQVNKPGAVTYQWYYSNNGGTNWGKISDNDGDPTTLNVDVLAYRNNYLYRCTVTDANGKKIHSEAGALKVKTSVFEIVEEPADVTNKLVGDIAVFHVGVTEGAENLTYQWYYSNNGGTNWGKISDNDGDPTTLNVDVLAYRNNYLYKCVITSGLNVLETRYAKLVVAKIEVSGGPEDFSGAVGGWATFKVDVTGEDLTYQWYYSNNGGTNWGKISDNDDDPATLNVEILKYRNNYLYRCVITDKNGNKVTSQAAKLTILTSTLSIEDQTDSIEGAVVGETYQFTVDVTCNTGVTYEWYYSNNGGTNWGKCKNTTLLEGYHSETLSVEMRAYREGYLFKCVITDEYGNTVTSDPVGLYF